MNVGERRREEVFDIKFLRNDKGGSVMYWIKPDDIYQRKKCGRRRSSVKAFGSEYSNGVRICEYDGGGKTPQMKYSRWRSSPKK